MNCRNPKVMNRYAGPSGYISKADVAKLKVTDSVLLVLLARAEATDANSFVMVNPDTLRMLVTEIQEVRRDDGG
jgi:hypothetical protein